MLNNKITPQQLMNFNLDELRILRNMIYAKYGYRFTSSELREYFSQFSWYNGTESNVENLMTYTDHRNIRIIQGLENHYPFFISYKDVRLKDLSDINRYVFWQNRQYTVSENLLIIMGWSIDSKLFVALTEFHGMESVRIYDLWENKTLPIGFPYHYNLRNFSRKTNMEVFNRSITVAETEYNILPFSDICFSTIIGYSIYSREIRDQPDPHYSPNYHFEIGLRNNINNNEIKLGNIYGRGYRLFNRSAFNRIITEDDIWYLCIKSPYEENILALIVIIPSWQGGDIDGPITYFNIFGINLNELTFICSMVN
jgi:hypothetical protein